MSRFWGGLSDSESEEEEEDDFDSDEEQGSKDKGSDEESGESGEEEGSDDENAGKSAKRDFFDQFSSDEEDDSEKRVVRSAAHKRTEAMNNASKAIQNSLKVAEWTTVADEWENLVKVVQKASLAKLPKLYIKTFADLEAATEAAWTDKEATAKLDYNNKKSLTTLRQRLRKSKAFHAQELEAYRANPAAFEGPEEESGDEDDGFVTQKRKGKKDAGAEEEEAPAEKIKPEQVEAKLIETLAERGRKNTDRKKMLAFLRTLLDIAESTPLKSSIIMAIIITHLDYTTSISSSLPVEIWKNAVEDTRKLFELIDANPSLVIREDTTESEEEETPAAPVPAVTDEEGAPIALPTGPKNKAPRPSASTASAANALDATDGQVLVGSVVAIIERLDDEFTKSLQHADQHTNEYIDRLRLEGSLYEMIVRAQRYYERLGRVDPLCRITLRRVEHIYFKTQSIQDKIEESVQKRISPSATATIDSTALLHQLSTYLYKNANERIRTRALLCDVYHHALHGRYYKARDLMLMSHLQETINLAAISTQILYNRAMVQLGLCAFRHGFLREAQHALAELEASSRIKELLAQGVVQQRSGEKNVEQEKLERLRQVPFHMHINQELIECVHLVCSMCIEIPLFAANTLDSRKRNVVSRPFRRVFEMIERQQFSGPPENTREHIVQASKALLQGDWARCRDLILSIKIWNLMSDKAAVLEMLSTRIQEEGLRTYLFTYSNYYDSISLAHLASMFGMAASSVHSIISKMIFNEELRASLDQVSGLLLLHRTEPNRLQNLALQYADKLGQLIDSNERTLEIRAGPREERRGGEKRTGPTGPRTSGQRQPYNTGNKDYQRRDRQDRGNYQERTGGGNYQDRQNQGQRRTGNQGGARKF